jgi:DNA-directed RNA polymerase sigma subunit (sigma70/sigma32)
MNSDHTLEEVGQQFSVTRERIRQIEAKAIRKLKHHKGPMNTLSDSFDQPDISPISTVWEAARGS